MTGLSIVGAAHVAMGSTALITGAAVMMMRKGTARHRWVGRIYAVAILLINGSALSIYDLTGRPNAFHALALFNLTTVSMGLLALWRWRQTGMTRDLVAHQSRMAMNYVGLWMAFITELLINPMMGFSQSGDSKSRWPLMIALTITLFLVGGHLVTVRAKTGALT